jgi:hypothetical protein
MDASQDAAPAEDSGYIDCEDIWGEDFRAKARRETPRKQRPRLRSAPAR